MTIAGRDSGIWRVGHGLLIRTDQPDGIAR
jgi:hypothetical protein